MRIENSWIGIDFGTCYTSAARLDGNNVVMIPVRDAPDAGSTQRPTVAYITKDGTIKTGHAAEAYRYSDSSRFFAEFKLDIIDDEPLVSGVGVTYADLVAAILYDVLEDAKRDNNGITIENAVITVPVIYTKSGPQWKVMLSAAKKAGFKQVEILYEPEAAALYYQHISGEKLGDLTLVYDLGGGTFDPALIESTNDGEKILKTGRDYGLKVGGVTFDTVIYAWLKSNRKEVAEAVGNKGKEREYVALCKDLKHLLSGSEFANKPLPHNPNEEITLKRSDFEQMIDPLIDQTLSCCSDLLKSCKKDWSDLSRILFIGGSTHIPLIRKKVVAYLNNAGAEHVEVTRTTIDGNKRVDPICAVAAGAVIIKLKDRKNMDAKQYEQERNRLIGILDDILEIEGLRSKTKEDIQKIRNKSLENNFEIVLVGEFQGGKSTTFNTICDGREISPRGAMIKTSACKISACNLADPNAEEYALVTWKEERELLLGMIKLIEPYLRKAQPERFGQATQEQMIRQVNISEVMMYSNNPAMRVQDIKPLDIHNPDDMELIRNSLHEQWKIYKKNPDNYEQEDLDTLYISSLIAHFINSPFIANLRKTQNMSVYEIGKLVTFPMDWTSRWQAGLPEAFRPEEVAFVFVSNVRCFIHSSNLARLGCVITDCPGLFTSPWDTEVAHKAMLEADAILYLFGGSKTLNQGDIRALNEIRKVKMEHKLVYAINVTGKIRNIENNVLPENVSKLRALGFEVSESDIHLYHALLGLCSRNGIPIKDGVLDEYSMNRFVKVAQTIDEDYGNDVKEVWVELADEMIGNIDRKESIEKLDVDNVRKVAVHSRIDDLFEGIEQIVIQKKAHAILVSQGGERASAALALLEGDLKSKEEVAKRTEAEFKMDVIKARDELEKFQEKASEAILKIRDPLIATPLAENFENSVVLASIPQIAERITEEIVNNLLSFEATFKRLKGKISSTLTSAESTSLEEELKPLIQNSIEYTLKPATEGWFQSIKDGESTIYNATIGAKVNDISQELGHYWKEIVDDNKNTEHLILLEGLELILPSGTFSDNTELLNQLNTASLTDAVNTGSAVHFAGDVTGFIVGTVVFFVCGAVLATLPLWVPTIVVLLPAIIIAIIAGASVSDIMKKGATSKIKANIEDGLKNGFNEPEAKNKLRRNSLDLIYPLQEIFINHFRQQLKKQLVLFENRVEESKRLFQEKEQVRKQISVEANELRVKKISPAKSKIDSFIDGVLKSLGTKRENQ